MDSLIRLSLNENTDMTLLGDQLYQCSGCILEYGNLNNFKTNFNKFSSILYEHADRIKAIMSIDNNEENIFQSNVYIISTIEDKFDIPINNLFISSDCERSIKDIGEFYYQDLCDGSFNLDIINSSKRNPITIIEWILMSDILQGTNLSIDMNVISKVWLENKEIFDSIYTYINSFVFSNYIQMIK